MSQTFLSTRSCWLAALAVLSSACLGEEGKTGACDARPGPGNGVTVDAQKQLNKDSCVEYDHVDYSTDLATECRDGSLTHGAIGTWAEGGRCAPGEVLATCRRPEAGGTTTDIYYQGYPSSGFLSTEAACEATLSGSTGVWCEGASCP
jgi:hypothetical protein